MLEIEYVYSVWYLNTQSLPDLDCLKRETSMKLQLNLFFFKKKKRFRTLLARGHNHH